MNKENKEEFDIFSIMGDSLQNLKLSRFICERHGLQEPGLSFFSSQGGEPINMCAWCHRDRLIGSDET